MPQKDTVFPHISSLRGDLVMVANSNSCHNISIFYLINLFFAVETMQGRKLHDELRYLPN